MLTALILAGGKGTRFWPLSTEEKPKQFLNLIGDETMIQMTVNRIKPIIPIERIFVCTAKKYVDLVREQLPELPERNIIIEPEGRNTAPCISLSAFVINRYYNDSTMLVLPSDHLIENEDEFRSIVLNAASFIDDNRTAIITLGMKPSRAEIGYGYIQVSDKEQKVENCTVVEVKSFVEKPNREKAEEYLKSGLYLWNGGMFLWNSNNILDNIKKYSSKTYMALKDIKNITEDNLQRLINERYGKTEAISIDYAVLEKAENIFVIPSEFGWDDIGTWRSVERYKKKDENNNIITNNVRVIESKSNMAINQYKKVVMIGIEDIMTVETDDAIFIVNKEYMDNLRDYQTIV